MNFVISRIFFVALLQFFNNVNAMNLFPGRLASKKVKNGFTPTTALESDSTSYLKKEESSSKSDVGVFSLQLPLQPSQNNIKSSKVSKDNLLLTPRTPTTPRTPSNPILIPYADGNMPKKKLSEMELIKQETNKSSPESQLNQNFSPESDLEIGIFEMSLKPDNLMNFPKLEVKSSNANAEPRTRTTSTGSDFGQFVDQDQEMNVKESESAFESALKVYNEIQRIQYTETEATACGTPEKDSDFGSDVDKKECWSLSY